MQHTPSSRSVVLTLIFITLTATASQGSASAFIDSVKELLGLRATFSSRVEPELKPGRTDAPNEALVGTTYTWNQAGASASWATATNWTPTRTTPAATDILVFNDGMTDTANSIPTQTIGQLLVSGNTTVNLQANAASTVLTIAGDVGNDLDVGSGSALNINVPLNTMTVTLATGATGSFSGNMTCSSAAHRLDAADAGAITFNSGAIFTQAAGCTGNAFTAAGTANAIVFASGSTFVSAAGSNPFGLTAPGSKVVFQAGSLFSHQQSATPSFSGRTYANFELNLAATTVSVTGGAAVSVDNLTVSAGTFNFNMTGAPGHAIKGNISVASGATLNVNPGTAGTVNLSGSSTQTLSGAGAFTFASALSTFVVNNANGISLSRTVTFNNGTLTLTSGNITTGANTLSIGPGETVNHTSGHVIGNLTRTFAAAGSKTFDVGTANGYSPVTVNMLTGTFPADFTATAVQGTQPNIVDPTKALSRYWTLTGTGVTADLTFNYLDPTDIPGTATEGNFVIQKYNGGFTQPGGTVNTGANTALMAGVTSFSDWTLAEPGALGTPTNTATNTPTNTPTVTSTNTPTNTPTPLPLTITPSSS